MAGKPVSLTRVASLPTGSPAPQPLVIVGTIPGSAITKAANVAVDTTPADATAVATDLKAVVDSLIAAGLMAGS